MIMGYLLLIWGIGIVILALKIQSDIQEAKTPDTKMAREMFDNNPIIFCVIMGLTLLAWPLYLIKFLMQGNAEKGK
jgi:hypothetical protein